MRRRRVVATRLAREERRARSEEIVPLPVARPRPATTPPEDAAPALEHVCAAGLAGARGLLGVDELLAW